MSSPLPNIFLVGPMGAGKSSIGRQLASIAQCDFFDSDAEIESRTGANIPWIFDVEGEDGFRNREESIIDELTKKQSIVLATGGGCVEREENRSVLKSRGIVVFLETSLEQQLQRTARDKNRPLLQTDDPKATLKALMIKRLPLYQELADIVVDTNQPNLKEVAQQILSQAKSLDK